MTESMRRRRLTAALSRRIASCRLAVRSRSRRPRIDPRTDQQTGDVMSDVHDVRGVEASHLQPIDERARLGYRPELDGLRAVAVLAVIVFHYWDGSRFRRGGFLGVDLFFVLS